MQRSRAGHNLRQLVMALVFITFITGVMLRSSSAQAPTITVPDAGSGKRVALIIANTNYTYGKLKNPTNDGDDMTGFLRSAGFEVMLRKDLNRVQMLQTLRDFQAALVGASVSLVYFSGHGVQAGGVNYLVPVDAVIRNENDILLQNIPLNSVFNILEAGKAPTNLVILDACRNNPFVTVARSLKTGLAEVSAPSGTLISFSTAPGRTASDNPVGRNGLFTQELLMAARVRGRKIEDVLKTTRIAVERLSRNAQVPWENSSLKTDFLFYSGNFEQQAPAPLSNLQTNEGTLSIDSEPRGATVAVNDVAYGKTPLLLRFKLTNAARLPVNITLSGLSGYKELSFTTELIRGHSVALPLQRLRKAPPTNVPTFDPEALFGKKRTNSKDGAEMVWIPRGTVMLGGKEQAANPLHSVTFSYGYWMYSKPVTVAQFKKFWQDRAFHVGKPYSFGVAWREWVRWDDRAPKWGWKDNLPMVNISWEEAVGYCLWAGVRLPTEAEWERAARGSGATTYPWGNEWDPKRSAHSVNQRLSSPVVSGTYPANGFGIYDAAGNISEWCLNWFSEIPAGVSQTDPIGSRFGEAKVVRGGAWDSIRAVRLQPAYRTSLFPYAHTNSIGFRAVLDANAP